MAPDPAHTQPGALASNLARLISDVLVHHAPWTSEVNETTRRRITDAWLEGLERHATKVVGPFIDNITDLSDVPEPLASLLANAKTPTAQFGSTIQQFFVYGVMFSLASTALQPFTQVVANDLWKANPTRPATPPDIAAAVVRGIALGDAPTTAVPQWAYDMAAENGLDTQVIDLLVSVTGQPPAPTDLFEMVRRNIITEDQLAQGLREGDTRDEWIAALSKLRYVTLSPTDMVRAAVQAQLPYDQAESLAAELGLEPAGFVNDNPDWFKIAYDIEGRPPGPMELGHLARRGVIPWTGTGSDALTFQQGIAESDIKTKWTDVLEAITQWWPEVEETRSLLINGAITEAQADSYWTAAGVPADLLPALHHRALVEQVDTDKVLARGQVLSLLYDGIYTEADATQALELIGYTGKVAQALIDLTLARRRMRALDMAVRKIGSYFVGYKLTATLTKEALQALGIPDDQISDLLEIWDVERQQPVRLPTVAQLGRAVKYSGLDFDVAVSKAELLGYTAYDATLIIASEAETQPPNGWPPDQDPGVDV